MPRLLISCLLVVSLLAACAGGPPIPTASPAPSATPEPTALATATPTPTATATSLPTPTPLPTATATLVPSATATPMATATPAVLSPLTGLPLGEPARRAWQPLAIQIDNDPAARPQTGLNAASVIVETPTEAGVTRLTALYLDQDAATVGPVRSARLVDLELAPEYQAILVSAGGAAGVLQRIEAAGLRHVNLLTAAGAAGSWRSAERPAPYNLYLSTAGLRQTSQTLGLTQATTLLAGPFGPLTGVASINGRAVAIPYSLGPVRFIFDATSGRYQRLVGGALQRDAGDGQPVTARNVIIQITDFTATDIIEDALGARSLAVRLRGQGEALLLRDGQAVRGTWQRQGLAGRTTYRDGGGQPIQLAPGQTWVALVPPELPVTLEP